MENQTSEEKILIAKLKLTQEILQHYKSIHNMINMVATGLVTPMQRAKHEKENSSYTILEADFDLIFNGISRLRRNGWANLDAYNGCKDDLKSIEIKEDILKTLK